MVEQPIFRKSVLTLLVGRYRLGLRNPCPASSRFCWLLDLGFEIEVARLPDLADFDQDGTDELSQDVLVGRVFGEAARPACRRVVHRR